MMVGQFDEVFDKFVLLRRQSGGAKPLKEVIRAIRSPVNPFFEFRDYNIELNRCGLCHRDVLFPNIKADLESMQSYLDTVAPPGSESREFRVKLAESCVKLSNLVEITGMPLSAFSDLHNPLINFQASLELIQLHLNRGLYSEPDTRELRAELEERYASVAIEFNGSRRTTQKLPSGLTEFLENFVPDIGTILSHQRSARSKWCVLAYCPVVLFFVVIMVNIAVIWFSLQGGGY